ncbi:MAG: right-handed parallel beta-helix repeat-containing protein, partial [Candidatus Aenigmatarchaeota archaeon]
MRRAYEFKEMYLVLVALILLLLVFQFAADFRTTGLVTSVSSCMDITSPGEYELSSDIQLTVPPGRSSCINIIADNVIFDCNSKSVTGPNKESQRKNRHGIMVANRKTVVIKNCVVQNFSMGISFIGTNSSVLDNNIVYNNLNDGILLKQSYENTLSNNIARNNSYHGIYLERSERNILTDNRAYNNSRTGVYLYYANFTTFTNNKIRNSNVYSNLRGLWLRYSSKATITGNLIVGNGGPDYRSGFCGICLEDWSSENTIYGNTLVDNVRWGIYTYMWATKNKILNNVIRNSFYYGMYIDGYSSDDVIANNTLYDNGRTGIWITLGSDRALIENNTVSGTGWNGYYGDGIVVGNINSTVINNFAFNNLRYGIVLGSTNTDTNVINNTVYNNSLHGIGLARSLRAFVSGNIVYDNNFSGVFIDQSVNNSVVDNVIYDNGDSGIYANYNANYCNISNNIIYDNLKSGMYILQSSNTNFTNNKIYDNVNGLILVRSSNNNLISNNIRNNFQIGMSIETKSDYNNLSENSISGSNLGVYTLNSGYNRIDDTHIFNNSIDLILNMTARVAVPITINHLFLDNPLGNFENYTSLHLDDTLSPRSSYIINWSPGRTAIPPVVNTAIFRQKFVEISKITGTVSIDHIIFSWDDSEAASGGYDDSRFGLWVQKPSGWDLLNNTPATQSNTLAYSNLVPSSEYAILQNTTPFCGDSSCNGEENCSSCETDCGVCPPICGDGSCNGMENCLICPFDCGVCPIFCGDGSCNGLENCSTCDSDCG